MKTIEVTDEEYDLLMALSEEVLTQDNNCQAFPYFWTPSSEKTVISHNDEGEIDMVYDNYRANSYTLEEYAEANEEAWDEYLQKDIADPEDEVPYRHYDEKVDYQDWRAFLEYHRDLELTLYSVDYERQCDQNPSLFRSDVIDYIETNQHHLGRNPAPYSHSIWRMPKMMTLVAILARINKTVPREKICHEMQRFVDSKEVKI